MPGSPYHDEWLLPIEEIARGSWHGPWPEALLELELFGEYPWGSWQEFKATPRGVKRRAWDWVQAKRKAENDAAEMAVMRAEMG